MEQVRRAVLEANNSFKTADHLAYVSYPLLKDNRLLLAITQNLYVAGLKGMDAVLHYEQLYKRINILPVDFESRMQIFERNVAPRMKIRPDVCRILKDLKYITQQHRNSPMEFSRREKFVICNDDYTTMKTIDIEMLKSYIVVMREFLQQVNGLS